LGGGTGRENGLLLERSCKGPRSPRIIHGLPSHAMNKPARGSLLGIEHLEEKEILGLLKLARRMNPLKARPLLRNKRIALLFYEASTRTRSSFEVAAKSMGAITVLVLSSGSSIEKGESLLDTGYTLRAVGADALSFAILLPARR
jgi:aspartate carbamoyltransferase catalytic subunit